MFLLISKVCKVILKIGTTAFLLLYGLLPAACNQVNPVVQPNKGDGIIAQLKQNNSVNVSLGGIMTFAEHGQNNTSYNVFAVNDIPLTWVDTTFQGNTTSNPAPGIQVVDHVHGVATVDGRYLEHISFWQEIKQEGQSDIIFDITVYAIPMDRSTGNCSVARSFVQTGDVKKYMRDLTYICDGVNYIGTDWTNQQQPPVLNIQFSQ